MLLVFPDLNLKFERFQLFVAMESHQCSRVPVVNILGKAFLRIPSLIFIFLRLASLAQFLSSNFNHLVTLGLCLEF